MSRIDGRVRRMWIPATIFILGFATLIVHAYHFLEEDEMSEALMGVILPAIVSVGFLAVGVYLYRSDLDETYHPRVLAWALGCGVGLAGLGAALVLYQSAHGAELKDFSFVVVNWFATGGFVGFFIGYYNANLKRARDRIADQRNMLSRRESALKRQNERLERIVSIVSHDVRNPLNVAEGYLQIARQNEDWSRLNTVSDALDRMGNIIDDTLAMAREGETVDEGERTETGLSDIAEASWESVDTGEATLEVEDDGVMQADQSRLRHVFENLFRNAVEHGSTGPASQSRQDAVEDGSTSPDSQARQDAVTVWVGRLPAGDGFFVADDGPGLPLDKPLFEAGYTTAKSGTGLGLSIVQEVVQAHGWDIEAAEGRDGGARFEITGVEFDEISDTPESPLADPEPAAAD